MAVYAEELATDITFPHFIIYRRYADGEHCGYRLAMEEGYVFYDITEEHWQQDSPDSEPYRVTHYFTMAYLPLRFNFDNWTYVAVLRSEVDENYIFGNPDEITAEEAEELQKAEMPEEENV